MVVSARSWERESTGSVRRRQVTPVVRCRGLISKGRGGDGLGGGGGREARQDCMAWVAVGAPRKMIVFGGAMGHDLCSKGQGGEVQGASE